MVSHFQIRDSAGWGGIRMIDPRILISLNPPRIALFEGHSKRNSLCCMKEFSDDEFRKLLVKADLLDPRTANSLREFVVFAPIRNYELLLILEQIGMVCTNGSCNCEQGKDVSVGIVRSCSDKKEPNLCACSESESFCA